MLLPENAIFVKQELIEEAEEKLDIPEDNVDILGDSKDLSFFETKEHLTPQIIEFEVPPKNPLFVKEELIEEGEITSFGEESQQNTEEFEKHLLSTFPSKPTEVSVKQETVEETINVESQRIEEPTSVESSSQSKFMEMWNGKINTPSELWTVNKVKKGKKKSLTLLKLYLPKSEIPVIEKQVVITENMHIKWYIFRKKIGSLSYFSEQFFNNFLNHFEQMKVCYGGAFFDKRPANCSNQYTFDNDLSVLRHSLCPMVIEDANVVENQCHLCESIDPNTIFDDTNEINGSRDLPLVDNRNKDAESAISKLKKQNEELQKRVAELERHIDSMLI